jgi:hypothetical protein
MRALVFIGALNLAACAVAPSAPQLAASTPACAVSGEDRAWIDRSLEAWGLSSHEITGIGAVDGFQAVFFDAQCVVASANALTAADARDAIWTAAPHSGMILLPDGDQMPAGVTSFTSATDSLTYFVMATPSVWRAGGVDGGPLGLETLMVAVLLHEVSHVAQSSTYGRQVTALAQRYALPESFSDDSLQARFGDNEAFSESVARETELFFQSAAATDRAEARRLAGEARDMMLARAARHYLGGDAYWNEAEDLWLTFEGAGQWAGYQWLIDPRGAAAAEAAAMSGYGRRSRWWSQKQGLAIVLALDRISAEDWKRRLYGDGTRTVLQLLDEALAEG